jgi:hypothetical protein
MATYRITDGQSLFDVALQKYGSVENAVKLVVDNLAALVNLNNGSISNSNVTVDESNLKLVRDFLLQNRNINTSDPIIKDGYAFDYGFTEGFFS